MTYVHSKVNRTSQSHVNPDRRFQNIAVRQSTGRERDQTEEDGRRSRTVRGDLQGAQFRCRRVGTRDAPSAEDHDRRLAPSLHGSRHDTSICSYRVLMLGQSHLSSYMRIPPGNYDHRAANLIPVTSDAHRKTKRLRMPPQSYRLSSLDGQSGLLDLSLLSFPLPKMPTSRTIREP